MTITEASEKYYVSANTLRYYERIGLIPPVTRNKSGIRDYTEEDCKWVEFIFCMRNAGLPIESLIEYVQLFQQGDATLEARKDLLVEQSKLLASRVEESRQTLERLNDKIARYEQSVLVKENDLKARE